MVDNVKRVAQDLLFKADAMANKDPEIQSTDRRKVVFCSIQDLESIMVRSDDVRFLAAVAAVTEECFTGWLLTNVHSKIGNDTAIAKPYPFDLDSVLPSWKRIKLN